MNFSFNFRRFRCWILVILIAQALILMCCGESGQAPQQTGDQKAKVEKPKPAKPVIFQGESVIYVVGPMSGRNAEKGQSQAAGARLAAEELNRQGGLFNREIVIKVLNDAGDPELAMEAAKKVADAANAGENVIAILMHEGSDPQLKPAKQIYLNTISGLNPIVVIPASTEPLPMIIDDERFFRLSAPNASQAAEIANYLQEKSLLDVVVVHDSTSYGRTLYKKFRNAVRNLDVRSIATFEILPDAVSYADVAARVREMNPTALFFAGADVEAAVFFSDLFGFEFQGKIYGSDRALSYNIVDEIGCQAEGMNFVSVLPDPSTVMGPEQLANYEALESRAAEFYTVAGYSGVEFVVKAFEAANALDTNKAATQARQERIKTIIGEVSFDKSGYMQKSKIHFFQVQGRMFKESFARQVGAGPKVREVTSEKAKTFLNMQFSPDNKPVIFAGLNWDSVQFFNGITRFIIESGYGYPTYSIPGSSVTSFQRLRKGEVHVSMEVWLPNSQELYDKAIAKNQIVDLGLNFSDAVQGWFVPRYVVEGDSKRGIEIVAPDLKSIDDLERYCHIFASKENPSIGRLIAGSSGWFNYKISCMKLKAYRLDDKFAQIATGSEGALFAALTNAYQKGEPILLYMYEPSWPMAKYDLLQIVEPEFTKEVWRTNKKCAFPPSQIKKLVHVDLPQRVPEIVEFLKMVRMDRDEVSRILVAMKDRDLKPETAALEWLKKNEGVWSNWVSGDVVQKVKQALSS